MTAALRRAAIAAVIAIGLFGAMVGLRTVPGEAGLVLVGRPGAVAALVAIVFVSSLAASGLARTAVNRDALLPVLPRRLAVGLRRVLAPALLAIALGLPFVAGRYLLDTGTLVLIYVMLGWGLNIVVGLAGLLDLGYVAFYAVGAYATAILSTTLGWPFWVCLPVSGLLAAAAGAALGAPVLRLRGDYLAIVTLAFGEIIRIVLNNWVSLTGGPNGISGIPRPGLFGFSFSGGGPHSVAHLLGVAPRPILRVIFLYYLILALALATNWVALRLRRLPIGRAWEALREDEIACRSLGMNVTLTKLSAFATSAMFGGFAGSFFAVRAAFVSPESFVFIESATVLAIVVLGGLGSQLGVALAAVVMIGGGEALREGLLDLSQTASSGGATGWLAAITGGAAADVGQYRMLLFGMLMVVVMVLRPSGLVAGRRPTVSLAKAAAPIDASLVAEGRG